MWKHDLVVVKLCPKKHLGPICLKSQFPVAQLRLNFQKEQLLVIKSWNVFSKKTILDPHVSKLQTFPIGPRPYVRLKFQKKCQVLVVKFWIKWGVVCENLTIGFELMSKKPFWPYQLGVLCSKSLGSFKVDSTFCSLEVNKTSGKK